MEVARATSAAKLCSIIAAAAEKDRSSQPLQLHEPRPLVGVLPLPIGVPVDINFACKGPPAFEPAQQQLVEVRVIEDQAGNDDTPAARDMAPGDAGHTGGQG